MTNIQMASFYVGDTLLGIHIDRVKEICQVRNATRVPNAISCVRGVVNLRGEVVTLIDLRSILNISNAPEREETFNIIIGYKGENVGLAVDEISDILTYPTGSMEPAPANVNGMDGRFIHGVCPLEADIAVLLNLDEVLSVSTNQSKVA